MSQTAAIFNLLRDGKLHGTDEIQRVVYGRDHLGVARIGARIFDIKKKYGVEIETEAITKTIYGYRLVKNPGERRESPRHQSETAAQGVIYCCVPVKIEKVMGYVTGKCPRCKKDFTKKS